jgi:AhpC/TSA family.
MKMKKALMLLALMAFVTPVFSKQIVTSLPSSDISGNAVDQRLLEKADLTLVFVWATYCGYCRDEMPSLQAVAAENDRFQVLGICADIQNRDGSVNEKMLKKAESILETAGLECVNVLPFEGMKAVMDKATALPYSVFVDKNGNQVGIAKYGRQSEKEIRASVERYLK